jgi:hypothetical protein
MVLTRASGTALSRCRRVWVPTRVVALYLRLGDHSGLTSHHDTRSVGVAPLGATRVVNTFVNTACVWSRYTVLWNMANAAEDHQRVSTLPYDYHRLFAQDVLAFLVSTVKHVKLATLISWPPVTFCHPHKLATLIKLATCHSWPPVTFGHPHKLATCHSWPHFYGTSKFLRWTLHHYLTTCISVILATGHLVLCFIWKFNLTMLADIKGCILSVSYCTWAEILTN